MPRRFRLLVFLIACAVWLTSAPSYAQQSGGGAGGVIEGFVTTQTGTIRLGGAQVVLHNSSNQEVAFALSEGDGHFRFAALQEGKYTITASLEGFAVARASVIVAANATAERSLDLPLATVTQTVEVMAPATIVSAADTLGSAESINSRETDEYANGTGLGGALRLLASVIEVPGGVSIKGGRPNASGCSDWRQHNDRSGARVWCTSRCPTTLSIRWLSCRIRTRSSTDGSHRVSS